LLVTSFAAEAVPPPIASAVTVQATMVLRMCGVPSSQ
jgi:hypothetical protein